MGVVIITEMVVSIATIRPIVGMRWRKKISRAERLIQNLLFTVVVGDSSCGFPSKAT
jgi:hypothetical protein